MTLSRFMCELCMTLCHECYNMSLLNFSCENFVMQKFDYLFFMSIKTPHSNKNFWVLM